MNQTDWVLVRDTGRPEVYHESSEAAAGIQRWTLCGQLLGLHVRREDARKHLRLCSRCRKFLA